VRETEQVPTVRAYSMQEEHERSWPIDFADRKESERRTIDSLKWR
jgi:hypothetical protein